jgi:uncharacterized protein DUF6455
MTTIVLLSFVAILAVVGYALAVAWRQAVHQAASLPLYGMLRTQGISPGEASDAASLKALAHAARRCAFCGSGAECRQRVAAGSPAPVDCVNGALFARLARPSA